MVAAITSAADVCAVATLISSHSVRLLDAAITAIASGRRSYTIRCINSAILASQSSFHKPEIPAGNVTYAAITLLALF
jgi:hypothetical protein